MARQDVSSIRPRNFFHPEGCSWVRNAGAHVQMKEMKYKEGKKPIKDQAASQRRSLDASLGLSYANVCEHFIKLYQLN